MILSSFKNKELVVVVLDPFPSSPPPSNKLATADFVFVSNCFQGSNAADGTNTNADRSRWEMINVLANDDMANDSMYGLIDNYGLSDPSKRFERPI